MNRPALYAGLVALWSAPAFAGHPAPSPKFDLHGHALPDGAVARLGDPARRTVRTRDFSFSPDGRLLARQRDCGVDVRELATGRDVTPPYLAGLTDAALFFAPDGRHVVVEPRAGRCRVFDPQSGEVKFDLTADGRHPWFAALSRNGRSAFVRWYDGRGGAAITVYDLSGPEKPVGRDLLSGQQGHAALTADGSLLVAATEVGARAFEVATGKELPRPALRHLGYVSAAALSPDGKTLAAAQSDNLRLYPVSPDGIGEPVVLPPVELRGGMSWSQDGRELLLACRDAVVRLDGKTGELVGQARAEGEGGPRSVEVLSADGRFVVEAGGLDPAAVWETHTGKVIYRYPDRVAMTQAVCPSPGTVVTLSAGLRLEEWGLPDGRPVAARRVPCANRPSWVTGQLSPDGRVVAVYDGWSQILQVFDAKTARPLRAADGWTAAFPSGLGFATGTDRLVVAADGRVAVADWTTGRLVRELPGPGLTAGFSPDGRLVAILDRNSVKVVELATNRVRRSMSVPEVPLDGKDVRFTAGRVRFSRDGSRVAIFGPCYRVGVWSVADGELLFEDRGDRTNLYSDVWPGDLSPDGRLLAYPTDDGHGVRVLDLTQPRPGPSAVSVCGRQGRVADLVFSPDGRHLVSAGSDGTGLVWDVAAVLARGRPKTTEQAGAEALWEALADPDAEKAGQAIEAMVRTPSSAVAVIAERLPAAEPPDPEALRKLVADLDSTSFGTRDQAERALRALRELAAQAITEALREPHSAEHRERLERLLEQVDGVEHEPARVRALRAVEVLERIGSTDARRVLERLAGGTPAAKLTREAKAALGRLDTMTGLSR